MTTQTAPRVRLAKYNGRNGNKDDINIRFGIELRDTLVKIFGEELTCVAARINKDEVVLEPGSPGRKICAVKPQMTKKYKEAGVRKEDIPVEWLGVSFVQGRHPVIAKLPECALDQVKDVLFQENRVILYWPDARRLPMRQNRGKNATPKAAEPVAQQARTDEEAAPQEQVAMPVPAAPEPALVPVPTPRGASALLQDPDGNQRFAEGIPWSVYRKADALFEPYYKD